ncbi:HEAT repeat domain-containing protein [Streptomyces mirabilis]|uniref:HEAT repeat domain-containing protein n=1 Tax=Streptomyces mirabilis TaxID=68239 RepID=UPI0036B081F7
MHREPHLGVGVHGERTALGGSEVGAARDALPYVLIMWTRASSGSGSGRTWKGVRGPSARWARTNHSGSSISRTTIPRPNFPTARLAAYADPEDPEVRALAVRDPETAPAVVERLTKDPDPAVRAAAARHPNLPRPRLTELLDDEELARPAAANCSSSSTPRRTGR